MRLIPRTPAVLAPIPNELRLDVAGIYSEHAQFLWKCLYRMGIPEADLADQLQEVLLVVHRRLHTYDQRCRLTTWLFGICLRVAATARRNRRRRPEDPMDPRLAGNMPVESRDPECIVQALDARRRLEQTLDSLDPEKRAVLVMFELEGMGCQEIAELLGVPKGTVFSRLASARQAFTLALQRLELRDKAGSAGGR